MKNKYGQAFSRRDFLKSSLAVTAASSTIPTFIANTALAAPATNGQTSVPGINQDRILVMLQLSGGNDGLNTLIPYANDMYYENRPELGLTKKQYIKINDDIAVNSAFKEVHKLYEEGEVAWVQGVGYPNPNRSHFRSMDIIHTASDSKQFIGPGWLGRYFDNQCSGSDPIPSTAAFSVSRDVPRMMKTKNGTSAGIVLQDAKFYAWQPTGRSSSQNRRQKNVFEENQEMMGYLESDSSAYLNRSALDAAFSSELVAKADKTYRKHADYPNSGLGRDLQLISKLISARLGGQVFYASTGGFDTHSEQKGRHENLLGNISKSIEAFREDLRKKDLWDKVTILGFSEFGRRVAENDSTGTDHGAAAPMFLIGRNLNPGLHGAHPSLHSTDLLNGDLKHNVDFREIYSSILAKWLGADPDAILGRSFYPLDLFKPV